MTPRASHLPTTTTSNEAAALVRDAAPSRTRKLAIAKRKGLRRPCANVLGVQVDALDMTAAISQIEMALAAQPKGYVCMAGVHGIMEAQRDGEVRRAFAESFMVLPDGMPTVWVGRLQGLRSMQRVAGPDLMLEVFRREQFAQYSHFLYGGKPGVAQELAANLSRRFPSARIVGTYTPPFHDLTLAEERNLICAVRKAKPSIIWVGISTPRQEMFMRRYLPLLDTSLMFGVGAAFDFHTGRIRDCADWIKRAGLQWFHRLVQDPGRLLWRYLRNNPEFVWRIALQLLGVRTNADCDAERASPAEFQLLPETQSDLCSRDYL
jgi:N-acetylglucosaminyldiphosphoundecaprenol N-acetyl-beta-D-mannosaminyltransferase